MKTNLYEMKNDEFGEKRENNWQLKTHSNLLTESKSVWIQADGEKENNKLQARGDVETFLWD